MLMDFSNLTVTFDEFGIQRRTIYRFGKSRINATEFKEGGGYYLSYDNNGETKLAVFSEDLPKLFQIEIKRLYEAIDITSKDIESCIKSIQAWKRRTEHEIL